MKILLVALLMVLAVAGCADAQPTPVATPNTDSTPRGLGITRAAIQAPLEEMGFVFEYSPLQDGRHRMLSSDTSQGIPILEIIGPAHDVTSVGMMWVVMPDKGTNVVTMMIASAVVTLAVPSYTDRIEWVGYAIDRLTEDGTNEVVTRLPDAELEMTFIRDLATLGISIKGR